MIAEPSHTRTKRRRYFSHARSLIDTGSGIVERRLPREAVAVLKMYRRVHRLLQIYLSRAVIQKVIYHTAVITVATGVSGVFSFGLYNYARSGRRIVLSAAGLFDDEV